VSGYVFTLSADALGTPVSPPLPKKGELHTIVHNGASVALGGSYPSRRGSCLRSGPRAAAGRRGTSPPPVWTNRWRSGQSLTNGGGRFISFGEPFTFEDFGNQSVSRYPGGSHSQFPYRINRHARQKSAHSAPVPFAGVLTQSPSWGPILHPTHPWRGRFFCSPIRGELSQ